jgi:SAM-dependent methyltransferase
MPTLVLLASGDSQVRDRAVAMVGEIPGAVLQPLDGGGDGVPPAPSWPALVPALLRHTSGGWPRQADRLAASSVAAGKPTGWFESLYGAAVSGEVDMPWDRMSPHPLLVRWMQGAQPRLKLGRAVVVGSGLGADAAYLAGLGFDTLGFDISPSAVAVARQRHSGSNVEYVVADLFDLPQSWQQSFDLVVEIFTVQALPDPPRRAAISKVPGLVAPGGRLVVIAARRADDDLDESGPPWPLTRGEIDAFASDDVTQTQVEHVVDPLQPSVSRWVAEFARKA